MRYFISITSFFLLLSSIAYAELFLTAKGGMIGKIKGGMGTHRTITVTSVTPDILEGKSEKGKSIVYVITPSTKLCDKNHGVISINEFQSGEVVTVSTLNDSNKHEAVGIRKGLILIRESTMSPVAPCE